MGFFKRLFKPIKKIFKKVVKVVTKIVNAVVKPILNLTEGFLGMFGMSFSGPEMPSPEDFDNTQQGILLNKQSNVANIPVVYGTRKVGGTRVFVATGGSDSKYLYVALAVAEGEIDSFTKIYINDQEQNLDSFATGGIRSVTSKQPDGEDSSYYVNGSSRAKFEFFTGTETQSSSSLLREQPTWTNEHRLQGVAYVACRFEWVKAEYDSSGNQKTFNPWGGIPNIQVVIRGKKVLKNTSYSSSDDTTTDSSTYESTTGTFAWTDNPADCLLDYLRNPRYGKGLNNNRISFADFDAAAQTCDISQTYGGDTGTAAFLTCNTVISTSDSILNNTKKLLQSCRGFMPYTDGKYRLKIEANESVSGVQVITDDHITSPLTIASIDKNARYNTAKVTFANSLKDYESDTVVYTDSTYKTEDGGEELVLQISAPSITELERAQYYGKYLVDRSRNSLTCSFNMTNEGQNIKPGDLVKVTHKFKAEGEDSGGTYEYLFNEKVFRVLEVTLNYDNTVAVDLIEHVGTIFTVTALNPDPTIPANSNVIPYVPVGPAPTQKGKVAVSTVINGQQAALIFRTSETDPLADTLQIEFRVNGSGITAASVSPYADGRDYNFGSTGGRDFKPGDQIKYQVTTRRGRSSQSRVATGTVYIGGTVAGSTFSQNYSGAGWS